MLILLPPSEGKAAPSEGAPLDLDSLVHAEALGECRARLLDALEGLAKLPRPKAVEMLGVSAGQAGEVDVDADLRNAPTAPAAEVYAGVLYDRLGLGELSAAAHEQVLIASALWGVVRPADRIPYYRFSAKARLDPIGPLAAWWRGPLRDALPDEEGELIVDMRSGAYAAAWKPKQAMLLAVRAFTEQGDERKPVSQMAKAVRGEVARALLEAEKPPADPEAAASIAERTGHVIELTNGYLDAIVEP
jgi:cytoplasmic iron level regulating protein YaaA (DUF328/UPF0246 family)